MVLILLNKTARTYFYGDLVVLVLTELNIEITASYKDSSKCQRGMSGLSATPPHVLEEHVMYDWRVEATPPRVLEEHVMYDWRGTFSQLYLLLKVELYNSRIILISVFSNLLITANRGTR